MSEKHLRWYVWEDVFVDIVHSLWGIKEGRLGEGGLGDFSITNYTLLNTFFLSKLKILVCYRFFLRIPTSSVFLGPPGAK